MHFDLQEAIDKIPNNTDFKSVIDYIIEKFHVPSRKILPELEEELDFLVQKYSEKYPEFIQIKELYKQFTTLFLRHINREEDLLFPEILELWKYLKNWEKFPIQKFLEVEINIKKQNIEHEEFEIYWASFLGLLLNSKIEKDEVEEYFDLVIKLEEFRFECIEHSKIESFHLDILVMNAKGKLV